MSRAQMWLARSLLVVQTAAGLRYVIYASPLQSLSPASWLSRP